MYDIGDRVASIAIGIRAAFIGTIESNNRDGWNVRADDDGKLWVRDRIDLRLVRKSEDARLLSSG